MTSSRTASSLAVLAVSLGVFLASPNKGPSDLIWTIPSVLSVLHEGNLTLEEYEPSFDAMGRHGIEFVDGKPRNFFPIGPTLFALPAIGLFDQLVSLTKPLPFLSARAERWNSHVARTGVVDISFFFVTEFVLGSLLMSLTCVVFFWLVLEWLSTKWALVLTAVFAFCTPVWSTASRDLGQHGPSIAMLVATAFTLVRARNAPRWFALSGVFIALAWLMRPTNALAIVGVTALVALRWRRQLPLLLAGLALVVIPFVAWNVHVYDSPLPTYYRPSRLEPLTLSRVAEALAGNLVSPARGIFIYSPVFLFALFALKARVETLLGLALIGLHWFVVSTFPHWWGGHSNGPRFMADLTPVFCLLLVPVFRRIAELRPPVRALFIAACLWSAFTHGRSATSQAVWQWNATPLDVDQHPERLWNWSDPPFLR